MRTSTSLAIPLVVAALCASAAFAQDQDQDQAPTPQRATKLVPSLRRAPKVDGTLSDLKQGLTLNPSEGNAWTAKVGYQKDTLYVGVSAKDEAVTNADLVELSIFFPGAGTTATGHVWRFAIDGLRATNDEALPDFAAELTRSKVVKTKTGFSIETAIPARALPRFPAKEPLVFDLCITFENRDEPGAEPVKSTNCSGGSMTGPALKLPDDFRRALKLKPSENVVGLEGRAHGWVGYHVLHYPSWVSSDEPLNAQRLRDLVAAQAYDPKKAGINLPDALLLPDGRTVLSVLSGKNPYEEEGKCDPDKELRFALYLVNGHTAERVLEWPASTCALGRAAAFELDDEGELTVGYTNGTTVNFIWSKDHFERTEVGSR